MILARYRKSGVTSDAHLTDPQINDFVDGLVRVDDRGEIDRHLAHCDTCRAEVSGLAELVAASRADAELVVAPSFLAPLVLATTVHERLMRRWVIRATRQPIIVTVVAVVAIVSTLTGWVVLACPDPRDQIAQLAPDSRRPLPAATLPIQCTEPWYFVVRDAARQRYKELRNWERDEVRDVVRRDRR